MTYRETEVLHLLTLNINEVVQKDILLTKIWGKADFFNGRSLDVFITKLRKKLSLDPTIKIINCRGQGYKLFVG
jgi:DNA-binding response OmpR family regulator